LAVFDPGAAKNVRADLVAKPEEPIIVHLGRADIPSKNRAGAIRYFAAYIHSGGAGTLLFIGRDGASSHHGVVNRRSWLALAEELGVAQRVIFLGERDDVADILTSADILLFTSTLEGLPGAIIEARAVGTPVVASTVPGAVYLAQHLPGIQLVSVQDEEEAWVAAIRLGLSRSPTAADRKASHESLRGTVFDATAAARSFAEVWSGRA
jgi:glycosyltransferase involved in cell wall biosynthesis